MTSGMRSSQENLKPPETVYPKNKVMEVKPDFTYRTTGNGNGFKIKKSSKTVKETEKGTVYPRKERQRLNFYCFFAHFC